MTDKERTEKIYEKIKTKYPYVTSKEEIDNLAIKLDKQNTLLMSLGCLAGAVVCGIIAFLINGTRFDETCYLFGVMAASGIFECFKTLGKYSKIEKRYRPILEVKYEGHLTIEKILQDGRKALKKTGMYDFRIAKLPLLDKEDETDVGIDNDIHHRYYLIFLLPGIGFKATYKVKREQYLNSVIGAEYFVVVTPKNEIAAVYQASNWTLDEKLGMFFADSQSQV